MVVQRDNQLFDCLWECALWRLSSAPAANSAEARPVTGFHFRTRIIDLMRCRSVGTLLLGV